MKSLNEIKEGYWCNECLDDCVLNDEIRHMLANHLGLVYDPRSKVYVKIGSTDTKDLVFTHNIVRGKRYAYSDKRNAVLKPMATLDKDISKKIQFHITRICKTDLFLQVKALDTRRDLTIYDIVLSIRLNRNYPPRKIYLLALNNTNHKIMLGLFFDVFGE